MTRNADSESWDVHSSWNMITTEQLHRFMPSYPWTHETCSLTRRLCWDQRMSPTSTAFAIIDSDEFAELPE